MQQAASISLTKVREEPLPRPVNQHGPCPWLNWLHVELGKSRITKQLAESFAKLVLPRATQDVVAMVENISKERTATHGAGLAIPCLIICVSFPELSLYDICEPCPLLPDTATDREDAALDIKKSLKNNDVLRTSLRSNSHFERCYRQPFFPLFPDYFA